MMALSLSLSAEIITTYQDIEIYQDAEARLGRTPLVHEFLRATYQVSQDDSTGKIVIAGFGVTPEPTPDPIPEPEPEPTPEPEPEPTPGPPIEDQPETGLFARTSKQQMYGCLTRVYNQTNSPWKSALNSFISQRDDVELINNCIEDIREVIRVAE